jgi:hypothetical protein
VFRKLENALYYYHEENELEIAKNRFEFNRENREEQNRMIVYWPYWGEVQNYLLPALDQDRLSRNTYELKRILKRRLKDNVTRHKKNRVVGGWVGSTIGIKAEKISDEQWLKIVNSRKNFKKEKWPISEGAILESSHEQFSRDLERVGKKDPNRIAKLALAFPVDVDNNYIRAVFDIIGQKEAGKDIAESQDWEPVPVEIAQKLYIRFGNSYDISVVMSFCRGLRSRAEASWNKDILNKISYIAKKHPDPELGKLNVVSSEDTEGKTVNSLCTNSMNV